MLDAIKLRGQGWDEKMRAEHSKKMKGGSNWMRGKHHNEETKRKIREKILNDFASGKRVPNKTMLSKPEKEIHSMLIEMGYRAKLGFRIEGKDFLYDIYVPERTLIVEYNGDYWHMNPSKYVATDYNSAVNKTAEEIWEKDETKKKVAVDNGYKFLRIWEKDYNKITDKRSMLKRLLSEI
jgi:G:T-mismatch repair DNA endonuclease (very short patch repair protein)